MNIIDEILNSIELEDGYYTLIKELIVYDKTSEDITKCNIRRRTIFRNGMNFIVDETNEGEKANNTGKTTALKMINVCLGSEDKNYIYTDSTTNKVIDKVYNEIQDKNITVNLLLTNTLYEENSKTIELEVELKKNGRRYINGKSVGLENYNKILNKVIFNNEEKKPSFRQLIGQFVRVNMKDDNKRNPFKYLHPNTKHIDYQNIYNFLFQFTTNRDFARISELSKKLKETENYYNNFTKKNGTIEELTQRETNLNMYLNPRKQELSEITEGENFEKKLDDLNKYRKEYSNYRKMIGDLEYELKKINEYLSLLEQNNQSINKDVLQVLYAEVKELNVVKKGFEELIEFNKQLNDNQKLFQIERRNSIKDKMLNYWKVIKALPSKYKISLGLIDDVSINRYNELLLEVTKTERKLGEVDSLIKQYKDSYNDFCMYKTEYEMISSEGLLSSEELEQKRKLFNEIYMKNSKDICGESYSLEFIEEGFPVKVTSMEEGVGEGRSKSFTAAYDISFLEYANRLGISVPKFIVYDVLETIDEFSFAKIVQEIDKLNKRDIEIQFIGSILSEKIKPYEFISEDMIVEKVSESEKYLKID